MFNIVFILELAPGHAALDFLGAPQHAGVKATCM